MHEFFFLLTAEEAIEAIARRVVELLSERQPELSKLDRCYEVLISTEEACKILNVSRPTIHSWKLNGLIPYHRKGRREYFLKSDSLLR